MRTPFGRYGGALAAVRPDDLLGRWCVADKSAAPASPERIDDVSSATPTAPARRTATWPGCGPAGRLPTHVPGATVNRLCGSGLEATIEASRAIAAGERGSSSPAAGVDEPSAPGWSMKPGHSRTNQTLYSTSSAGGREPRHGSRVDDLARGGRRDPRGPLSSRARTRTLRPASHRRRRPGPAMAMSGDDRRAGELDRDEPIRPDTTMERLARLRPAFRPSGTAGNSSPLNDGAAALLLASEDAPPGSGSRRWPGSSRGVHALDPRLYGVAPVGGTNRRRPRRQRLADLALVELNEAFAAQTLACRRVVGPDPEILNVNGGAVALGQSTSPSPHRHHARVGWWRRPRRRRGLVALHHVGHSDGGRGDGQRLPAVDRLSTGRARRQAVSQRDVSTGPPWSAGRGAWTRRSAIAADARPAAAAKPRRRTPPRSSAWWRRRHHDPSRRGHLAHRNCTTSWSAVNSTRRSSRACVVDGAPTRRVNHDLSGRSGNSSPIAPLRVLRMHATAWAAHTWASSLFRSSRRAVSSVNGGLGGPPRHSQGCQTGDRAARRNERGAAPRRSAPACSTVTGAMPSARRR